VEVRDRESAELIRSQVSQRRLPRGALRAALLRVPPAARDAWLDLVFEVDGLPDDGPELPRGCVPYLPCAVEVLLRTVQAAQIDADDVFVDVGSGTGRAAAAVHLLTGAEAIGLEVQPALVESARALAARLNVERVTTILGDAAELTGSMRAGSVFFFYCPFSGERLARVFAELEAIARQRPIRVCAVDLPLPQVPWLELAAPPSGDLAVYRSVTPASPGTARSRR